jgi:hypothetical protein
MKSNEPANSQPFAMGNIIGKVSNLKNIAFKEKLQMGKDNLQKTSLRIKENLSNTFHKKAEETNEFIDTVKHKNTKTKNLETLLGLDKSQLISSDKTTSFYKHSRNKIVIFEKDILENPCSITIKESTKVNIFLVKYSEYIPFLYPAYDEKDITGQIIYMDKDQVWYRDMDKLTLGYNNGNTMEFSTVKISELAGFTEEELVPYIKTYFSIIRSPKVSKLVKEKSLLVANIIRLGDSYVIYKNHENYVVYIYSYNLQNYDELNLKRLPKISLSSFDALLASDIIKYIKENNYPIEEFEEKGGYIEYNREVGRNKISVMRFKV